ncbi:MAG: hypothetical protein MI741_03995, partial [Rhodospirillales bacterium]|nr:hypothetical protein [Rhodospirillales bacterium]
SFADLVDVINPLQHIPVVSALYRSVTGDEIAPGPRIAGGALFGGPIGAAVAALNASVEQETGKDLGGHVMAFLDSPEPAPSPTESGGVMAASADTLLPEAGFVTAAGDPNAIPDLAALAPLPTMQPASPEPRFAESPGAPDGQAPINLAALGPLPASSTASAAAQSMLRRAQSEEQAYAAVSLGPIQRAPAEDQPKSGSPADSPPGALASEGGWFTEVMLAALDQSGAVGKYEAAARLSSRATDGAGPVLR